MARRVKREQSAVADDTLSSLSFTPGPGRHLLADPSELLGDIWRIRLSSASHQGGAQLGSEFVEASLEVENTELRNRVVELALDILELKMRQTERTQWPHLKCH